MSVSAALEGWRVTPATHENQEAHVGGLIDLDEFGERVRTRSTSGGLRVVACAARRR